MCTLSTEMRAGGSSRNERTRPPRMFRKHSPQHRLSTISARRSRQIAGRLKLFNNPFYFYFLFVFVKTTNNAPPVLLCRSRSRRRRRPTRGSAGYKQQMDRNYCGRRAGGRRKRRLPGLMIFSFLRPFERIHTHTTP